VTVARAAGATVVAATAMTVARAVVARVVAATAMRVRVVEDGLECRECVASLDTKSHSRCQLALAAT